MIRAFKEAARWLIVSLIVMFCGTVAAQTTTAGDVISHYKNVFLNPPERIPATVAVDAPLLGNGYTAAAIGGKPEAQHYYLARNDFWRLKSGFNESFPGVLGRLSIYFDALKDASYSVEQDLFTATTVAVFKKDNSVLELQSVMSATKDLLLITVSNRGSSSLNGRVVLALPNDDQFQVNPPAEIKFADTAAAGRLKNGIQWIQRGFVKEVDIKTIAAAACRIIETDNGALTLSPGQKMHIVCAFSSRFKKADPLQAVVKEVNMCSIAAYQNIEQQHRAWWHDYWNKSFVHIEDPVIEHQYYRSLYVTASCSRDPKFPPGIFGSWVTKEVPAWNGDYHLNYNYSAPFYALYSANRLQQALPYQAPLLDFMKRGAYYSQRIAGIGNGVLYPVGIGPLGIETTRKNELMQKIAMGYIQNGSVQDEGLFFGQKSNAAYCAADLSMQFYRTWDPLFARKVYPYIRSVAVFWQHYLKKEGDRYIIENDAIHEGTIGTMNPILSLGLVPMVLQTAIDMSLLLNVDKEVRKDWNDKMNGLATYTTQQRHGKMVFRYSEKGTDWWNDNTLGIQHIYPAGRIGLNSSRQLLEIARNTIAEMGRWQDFNGSNSFFPAAVRVGYDADTILRELHKYSLHIYPNGFQKGNPHGIENCSTVPNTINEMLCMGNQGVLRVFAVWPKNTDAMFENIRSEGAVLVSSVVKDNEIPYVKIYSEQGRTIVLQNPWPGRQLWIQSNKRPRVKRSGERIPLSTVKGEKLLITVSEGR